MGMPRILQRTVPGFAFAATALTLTHGCLAAAPGPGAPGAISQKARVDMAIRIPEMLRLTSIARLPTLVVPQGADAAGGVEVRAANVFEIVTTLKAYSLQFEILDPEVTAVDVEGLGEAVQVTAGGAVVRFAPGSSAERRVLRELTYRFHFAHGARPGPRPMPIALSVSAS